MVISIDDFMKTATSAQKKVLFNLIETGEKEKELSEEINRITGAISRGVYSSDGVGLTVCEDADDARVISSGSREKLETAREKMKTYMKKAVKLGMRDLGVIQRNYEHYVGEPIPVK